MDTSRDATKINKKIKSSFFFSNKKKKSKIPKNKISSSHTIFFKIKNSEIQIFFVLYSFILLKKI